MTKTKKNTEKTKQQKGPIRLNLNLRTRANDRNAPWKHYQGLSFICEARTLDQAKEFANRLKRAALDLAIDMQMEIPGAIYIPKKAADFGTEENQAPANPTPTRPAA